MNDRQSITRPDSAASVPFDYREAYSGLEELICTAQSRADVLCLVADSFGDRDVADRLTQVSAHDFQCLLFMIEETQRAVSALEQRYYEGWSRRSLENAPAGHTRAEQQ